jgi:hypothetical protein
MRAKAIILFLVILISVSAAEISCTSYCSITKGYDIKNYAGTLFFGTDGGLVVNTGGSNAVFDIDDGLFKADVMHIEKDYRGLYWLGHKDCSVSVFDMAKKKVFYLNDIEQAGVYSLNRIYSSGKFIYLATSGLLARYKYNETYKKYEVSEINSMTGNVKDVIVVNGVIYGCFADRLYSISESAQNINFLNNWTQLTGLAAGTVISGFAADGTKLYALSDNGLYLISGNTAVKQAVFNNENLYYGIFDSVNFYVSLEQVEATVVKSVPKNLSDVPEIIFGTEEPDSKIFSVLNNVVYFTSSSGYSYYDISNDTEYKMNFNVPKEKGIKKAIIDDVNGKLLYLTSYKFSYMRMSDDSFHDTMFITRGSSTNFHAKGDGLYICTWGSGVNYFQLVNDEYVYKKNYSFGSAAGVSSRYPVHPGIYEDNLGRIYISNWNDADGDSSVTVLNSAGIVEKSFGLPYFPVVYDVFVDYHKNKQWVWLGSSRQTFGAENGLGVGIYDGLNLKIKAIPMNEGIIDIVKDRDNTVWIATNNGVKYIDLDLAPSSPDDFSGLNISSVSLGPISSFIYDVEVNSINEKWFATDKGVSVLSSDNKSWRHYVPKYYSGSSTAPGDIIKTNLVDYVINDIEFDEKNGVAILSSSNGLVFLEYGKIFKTDKVKSGEIQTKPSPFINDGSSVMGFYFPEDGNNYDTAKIFDLKGFLVRGGDGGKELNIQYGWDGRDNKGKIVSTGVYQVIAFNKNDRTKKITGKIAVVRK